MLYWVVFGLVQSLQSFPLAGVAWLGRRAGGLAYFLDRRHRRVALENLALAFREEKSPAEIQALAREHFRRLGEGYACAVKTGSMSQAALARRVQLVGARSLMAESEFGLPRSRIFAIGHFGNFEVYAWMGHWVRGYRAVSTYRPLPQPRLNALLLSLRQRSGCALFARGAESAQFLKALSQPGQLVGLLSDQHAGRVSLRLPFFGRQCSTLTAPAVLAQRFKLPLHTAICFRTGLGRWRVEIGDEISTRDRDGRRRPVADVMREVNRAFEQAIRRDPANWFWVHRRWKMPAATPARPEEE